MTREEAIKCLEEELRIWVSDCKPKRVEDALRVAIKALEQETVAENATVEQSGNSEDLGTTKKNLVVEVDDCVSRRAVDLLCFEFLKSNADDNIAFYEHFLDLPSVKPKAAQEPCEDCCNGNQIEKAKLCQRSYLAGMEHKQEPKTDIG